MVFAIDSATNITDVLGRRYHVTVAESGGFRSTIYHGFR